MKSVLLPLYFTDANDRENRECRRQFAVLKELYGDAAELWEKWAVPTEALPREAIIKAVKLYLAIKEVIDKTGNVYGLGGNCLNESFHHALIIQGDCTHELVQLAKVYGFSARIV
jgi:hypothetical protein